MSSVVDTILKYLCGGIQEVVGGKCSDCLKRGQNWSYDKYIDYMLDDL